MKNYTTKPIELPLSTEKEYVLVDESLTNDDFFCLDISVIKKPFKPTEIDISGDMWLNNSCIACVEGETNISSFHEVIRQPESEAEWNGEGLPPVGTVCEMLPPNDEWFEVEIVACCKDNAVDDVLFYRNYSSQTAEKDYDWCYAQSVKFRQPETAQQRKVRERLEAAYELYVAGNKGIDINSYVSFEEFKLEVPQVKFFTAIVDKTNYHKEQN